MSNAIPSNEASSPPSVASPLLDFWLLGGASLLIFFIMAVGSLFRESNPVVQQKFFLVAPVFGLLAIFCNNPHFIASFRFGYSRGLPFIFANWFSLIAVPAIMLGFFTVAYFLFDDDFSTIGSSFRFGDYRTLGPEIMALGIMTMYATVGWHYAKQVYGCMMVYDNMFSYGLTRFEKAVIRYSLLALAGYQFLQASKLLDDASASSFQDPRFTGVALQPLGLPDWLWHLSQVLAGILFLACLFIFAKKWLIERRRPPTVFFIMWLALYVWWVQFIRLPEFYFLMVPFFHSLQYLPFAYKMERRGVGVINWTDLKITVRVLLLIALGVLAFELVPVYLDQTLNTKLNQTPWFFMTVFAVFINIHHFFIDSVVWRFSQPQVKTGLLSGS